jgi:CBS domain-containing protein
MKIDELMTRDVLTVTPETSLKEVAALLAERRISGLPVCDETGAVVGVISEADILRKEQGLTPHHGRLLGWLTDEPNGDGPQAQASTAGAVMTTPALTIRRTASASEAARRMVERQVNRLPVVEQGKLVGIVTRADLVRAFTRSDEEIEQEIRTDVLFQTLWVEPDRLELTVENGAVRVAGTVDTRSAAELVEAFVRRVPGVVSVEAQVGWDVDDLARRARRELSHLPRRVF